MTDAVIARGWVPDDTGAHRQIMGAVSAQEARLLASIVLSNNCKRCFETGVANGISTLAITQAVAHNGGHHFGMDPEQILGHRNAALCLLAEHGLTPAFTLLNGPSHRMAPPLLDTEERFDFAFIDGMHTFHYRLVDFFFANQLLRPGGWLVFHDILLPSMKKLFRFILTQGNYRWARTPELAPSLPRKLRYVGAAFLKRRPLWHFWPNHFANVLVLQKLSDDERPWNHFENF